VPYTGEQYRRLNVLTLFVVIGAFNLVTDVILLIMPLPVVVRMHTNWKRKGMWAGPQ
jgi:hypothetical protein